MFELRGLESTARARRADVGAEISSLCVCVRADGVSRLGCIEERKRGHERTLLSGSQARPAADGFVGHCAAMKSFDVGLVLFEGWGEMYRN